MTNQNDDAFDLQRFIPYLLNQAAEATSLAFQTVYKSEYGMTRTQWRVLANLGKFGAMTATEICRTTHIEKTKVSRGVQALAEKGFLSRTAVADDRRSEALSLTEAGRAAYAHLGEKAMTYDAVLRQRLGPVAADDLIRVLAALVAKAG